MKIKPLRRVLTLQPMLAIILPFGAVVLLGLLWVLPQIRAEVEQRQQQLARAVGMQVESHLHTGAAMVKAAAVLIGPDQAHSRRVHQRQLDALLDVTATLSSLSVISADGNVSNVWLKQEIKEHRQDLIGLNLSANPLFKRLSQDGNPRWSKTFLSIIHGGLVTAYGLRDGGTTLIGEVDLSLLSAFLEQISTHSDTLIMIVDHNGQIVADNNRHYTAQQLNIGNSALIRTGMDKNLPVTGPFDFAGVVMTGSITPIPSVDWYILVAQTDASLYLTLRGFAAIALSGIIAALAVGLFSSFLLARNLAARFGALTQHALNIADGDESGAWPTSSVDEFNQLSGSLQRMALRLQDSKLLYQTLFDELPVGVVLWPDPPLRPLQFNTVAHSQLGYTREEFTQLAVTDFHVSSVADEIAEHQQILRREGTASFDATHHTKSGEDRAVVVTLRAIELAAKPMTLAVHRDITANKMAEVETRNTNELLAMFMKHSPVYTFIKEVTPSQSRVLQVSDNYEQMLGIPAADMLGKTMGELFPPELAAQMTADDWSVVDKGEVLEVEEEFSGRNYTSIKFPIPQATRTLLAGYTIDITERKQAEESRLSLEKQLLNAQKLESLGVLAGGIAHDFNNILMSITGNTDLALRKFNQNGSPVEHLQRVKQAAERAAELARQMLAYSGRGKFQIENLDLNHLLEDLMSLLEVSISKKSILRLNLCRPLPMIEADATQLRQVVMNLVINASEALEDRSGEITVTTSCSYYSRDALKSDWRDADHSEGEYVCLEVADSGCGMDAETRSKLFDPFFTTKFTGRGLGMAAVQGIIHGHQGLIRVQSEPGEGSSFKVLLPVSNKPLDILHDERQKEGWRGGGKVLLVDDEDSVRGIAAEMLIELGFSVVTACDGCEALEVYRATPDIDFVILDLTMPRMDGEECFRALRQENPGVEVIISSGYDETKINQKLLRLGVAGFIRKPYSLDTLADSIQKAIRRLTTERRR